jgi:drug/metabolite transporter (DMT)-like permease
VGSALAFALDGPMAQAAYRQGLDPAAFGFWRALAGAAVLGGFLATRPRSGVLAGIRRMRRAAVIRLALAAVAGLGLNLALFQAFARLPVTVAVAGVAVQLVPRPGPSPGRIGVSLGSIAEAATGRDEGESIVTGQAVVC